jgi:Ni/Co efflux regulator RcnB
MRKILISLLLAGAAATPAIAAPHNWSDRQSAREDRQSAQEDRQSAREERQSAREDRSARSSNSERPQVPATDRAARADRADGRANFTAPAHAQVVGGVQAVGRADARDVQAVRSARQQARDDRRDNYVAPGARIVTPRDASSLREQTAQRRDQRVQERELRQSSRPTARVFQTRPPVVSNTPRPGTQPPLRAERHGGRDHHWDTNWRHNGRYDWQNHRRHHHSLFHLGFYFDPYGWGYQPYSIGWRLWPSYYGSRYWINDPWMYRLPYAPQGYVWVRYWNDALLVDTWSGTVVDVIPGFFW